MASVPRLRLQEDDAPKIHTIRRGSRWRAGMSIQMAFNVRTKMYDAFNKGIAELETCISVQKIWIRPVLELVFIDDRRLSAEEVETLAKNDGFDTVADFWQWFGYEVFEGQIIHWTEKRY